MMTLEEAVDIIDRPTEDPHEKFARILVCDAASHFDDLFTGGLPRCGGRCIGGSGGHKMWSRDCNETVTWSSWPDDGMSEHYCDKCRPNNMHGLRELPWAVVVRIAYALGDRPVST